MDLQATCNIKEIGVNLHVFQPSDVRFNQKTLAPVTFSPPITS